MTIAQTYAHLKLVIRSRPVKDRLSHKGLILSDMAFDLVEDLAWDIRYVRINGKTQCIYTFVDGSTVNMRTLKTGVESHIIPK